MPEDNKIDLFVKAALGDKADRFFDSELGQYLIGRSLSEIADLHAEFENTTDPEKWAEIRSKILIARKALEWLNEAIQEGKNAFSILQMENQNE